MRGGVEQLTEIISARVSVKQHSIVAVDGRCAAGKTTFAAHLQASCDCNVFHMDDFFLRPDQRTEKRLQEPGGNVDYERFLQEALMPLHMGHAVAYRPFDCKTQSLGEPVEVQPRLVNIIEGSYSCHPALWAYYDLHIFLDVEPSEQLRRIALRNGSDWKVFRDKWIPLEERYFQTFQVKQNCELTF